MAVGESPRRKDAVAKVTGRARYTDDLSMPGMLYAKYVRSPIAHGRVLRIDTKKARHLHGVETVFISRTCRTGGLPPPDIPIPSTPITQTWPTGVC